MNTSLSEVVGSNTHFFQAFFLQKNVTYVAVMVFQAVCKESHVQ